jgi:hypothetical protein
MLHRSTKNSASQNRHAASRHNFLIFRFSWEALLASFFACVTRHYIIARDMPGKSGEKEERGKNALY